MHILYHDGFVVQNHTIDLLSIWLSRKEYFGNLVLAHDVCEELFSYCRFIVLKMYLLDIAHILTDYADSDTGKILSSFQRFTIVPLNQNFNSKSNHDSKHIWSKKRNFSHKNWVKSKNYSPFLFKNFSISP